MHLFLVVPRPDKNITVIIVWLIRMTILRMIVLRRILVRPAQDSGGMPQISAMHCPQQPE